jgi:hypothetical protein
LNTRSMNRSSSGTAVRGAGSLLVRSLITPPGGIVAAHHLAANRPQFGRHALKPL